MQGSNAGCRAFRQVPKWGKEMREQGPQRRPKEERRRKQAGGRRDALEDGEGGCKSSSLTSSTLLAHSWGRHLVPVPRGQQERGERRVRKANENLSCKGGMHSQLHISCPPKVPRTKSPRGHPKVRRQERGGMRFMQNEVPADKCNWDSEPQCIVCSAKNENAAGAAGVMFS